MTLKIKKIGQEEQPLVVLDEAIAGAAALVDIAAGQRFKRTAPYYPGVRAPAPADYVRSLVAGLAPLIADVFGLRSASLAATACEFSLVTTAPADLAVIQRLPHYDGVDPNVLAVLHYLCDASHGGLNFYRHRATGFETIDETRFFGYKSRLEREIETLGAPPLAYMSGSTPLFEQTAHISASFNRIVIYRGTMLHSGNVPEGHFCPENPREGRLTINTFVEGAA